MMARLASLRTAATLLGWLAIATTLLLWVAPEEKTLGAGIKVVYLHVGATWAGLLGLVVAGALGVGVALVGSARLERWAQTIGWIALGFSAAGFGLSLVASRVNWGGVFWGEPRTTAALNTLVITALVQVLGTWPLWLRVRGLLRSLPISVFAWAIGGAPLVLHPRNPIAASSSLGIQLSFVGMFGLCVLGGAVMALHLRGREMGVAHPAQPRTAATD